MLLTFRWFISCISINHGLVSRSHLSSLSLAVLGFQIEFWMANLWNSESIGLLLTIPWIEQVFCLMFFQNNMFVKLWLFNFGEDKSLAIASFAFWICFYQLYCFLLVALLLWLGAALFLVAVLPCPGAAVFVFGSGCVVVARCCAIYGSGCV